MANFLAMIRGMMSQVRNEPRSPLNMPKTPKRQSSPEHRRMHTMLGWLAITVIINVLGFSIIFPLVPYIVRDALGPGVDPHSPRIGEIAAWLTAVYALMQFFFAPVWGRLSDKIGRKPVLIGSLAGDVVFYTLFGLSHSLTWLFAARILAGIFSSASLAVSQAYAADVTPPEHRAMGMGMIGASFGVGFVLGPAIGGALGHISLALPLFVSAGLALVNLVFIVRLLPEPEKHAVEEQSGRKGQTGRIAAMARAVTGPMGFLYLLTFLVTFAFANLEGTFTAYLMQHFGYLSEKSTAITGGIFAYLGLLLVLVQGGAIRPLSKRYGEANLVVAGVGLMAVGFLLFSLAPTLLVLMIGPLIPITVGNGLNTPSLRSLVSRKSAATVQGASLGLSASFDSLARATGPAFGGWLYARYGQAAPYWFGGAIMGLAFLLALARRREMAES
jgi:multidrug resistance protein